MPLNQARATYITEASGYGRQSDEMVVERVTGIIKTAKVTKLECLMCRCFCKPGWKKDKIARACQKYTREFIAEVQGQLGQGVNDKDVLLKLLRHAM